MGLGCYQRMGHYRWLPTIAGMRAESRVETVRQVQSTRQSESSHRKSLACTAAIRATKVVVAPGGIVAWLQVFGDEDQWDLRSGDCRNACWSWNSDGNDVQTQAHRYPQGRRCIP